MRRREGTVGRVAGDIVGRLWWIWSATCNFSPRWWIGGRQEIVVVIIIVNFLGVPVRHGVS